jgi:phosphoethanolamine N-methyltransferase
MMLDNDAAKIDLLDQNEVLSYLPEVKSSFNVLELGCGIGRLTTRFLTDHPVKTLHSTDFMQTYVDANLEAHKQHTNFTCACEDATKQDFGSSEYEMIFTNWLFMYLSETETLSAFTRIYAGLKPGGYFFLRESCFRQSGNKARSFNPTKYRSDQEYTGMIAQAGAGGFELVKEGASQVYIDIKNNENQRMWLFQKKAE